MGGEMNRKILALSVLIPCTVSVASCTMLKFGDKLSEIDALRAHIRETVADDARRDGMLKAVDDTVVAVDGMNGLVKKHRSQLQASIGRHATTRRELELLLESQEKERQKIIGDLADAHYEFKSLTTEKEWARLCTKMNKAFAALVRDASEGGES